MVSQAPCPKTSIPLQAVRPGGADGAAESSKLLRLSLAVSTTRAATLLEVHGEACVPFFVAAMPNPSGSTQVARQETRVNAAALLIPRRLPRHRRRDLQPRPLRFSHLEEPTFF
eukprot:m.31340 g.31340  ORF g.31340 m.31340 type:complete len:114 (+) comp5345_c0_seq1:1121-1462(+)